MPGTTRPPSYWPLSSPQRLSFATSLLTSQLMTQGISLVLLSFFYFIYIFFFPPVFFLTVIRFIGHPSLVQKRAIEEARLQNGQDNDTRENTNNNTSNSSTTNNDADNNTTTGNENNLHRDNSYPNHSYESHEDTAARKTNNDPSDTTTTNANSNANININTNTNINTNDNTSYSQANSGTPTTIDKRASEEGINESVNDEDKQADRKKLDHKDELRLFNIVFAVPAGTASQRANRSVLTYHLLLIPTFSCSYLHSFFYILLILEWYLTYTIDLNGWQPK